MKKAVGALVSDVTKDSPANRAGVEKGDVIVTFDDAKIQNVAELVRKVGKTAVGKTVRMKVLRRGKEVVLKVKVGKQSEKPRSSKASVDTAVTLGLRLRPVPDERAKQLGIKGGQGVLVIDVIQGSPAARGGIRAGDIILEVNRKAIRSVDELNEVVSKGSVTKGSDDPLFFIQRGVSKRYIIVPNK
jgi:serine protease Do